MIQPRGVVLCFLRQPAGARESIHQVTFEESIDGKIGFGDWRPPAFVLDARPGALTRPEMGKRDTSGLARGRRQELARSARLDGIAGLLSANAPTSYCSSPML